MISITLPKNEYRHTDILKYISQVAPYKGEFEATPPYFRCPILPDKKVLLIHLQNGNFSEKETYISLEKGVIIASMKKFKTEHPDIFQKYFNRIAPQNNPLVELNNQNSVDGVVVYIPHNVKPEKAIQIVSITNIDKPYLYSPRVLFIQEEHSECDLYVCSHTFGKETIVNNAVVEVSVAPHAKLNFIKLQSEHDSAARICNDFIELHQESHLNYFTFSLHGKLIRNNIFINLVEPHALCNVYGLSFTKQGQHVDNHVIVNHLAPECMSNSLYKNIVSDNSTIVFHGGILVAKNAQKTTAYQNSKAILLSQRSQVYAQPELKIYADDVKCSHGATVGQLDSETLFYMRARGISMEEAKLLQMWGFACEVLEQLPSKELCESIAVQVDQRLRGIVLKGCAQCSEKHTS